jgi:hypothetical protein
MLLSAATASHLVNKLLATGIVPEGFKTALIHPVYKEGKKSRTAPLSYRPVSIFCAKSWRLSPKRTWRPT